MFDLVKGLIWRCFLLKHLDSQFNEKSFERGSIPSFESNIDISSNK